MQDVIRLIIFFGRKNIKEGRWIVVGRLRQSSASSTLRNFVPSGAAHEAAAGHALSEPSDNISSHYIMQETDPFGPASILISYRI